MEATLITVGDEILIGQVVDTNSAWMGQELNLRGIKVKEIITISDTSEAIIETLKSVFENSDLILMTGGLGPTKDDITKKSIATYFGVEMELHEPTYEWIRRFLEKLQRTPTEAHKEQCFMPVNATLLHNKMGSAPGMWFDEKDKVLISMPGVPYEMKSIMEEEVFPRLKDRFVSKPIVHKTILTIGEGETRIAAKIENFENALPENLKLAYLPNLGMVRLRLSATGDNEQLLNDLLDSKVQELQALIPDFIFGYGNETIQEAVGKLFIEKNKTIGTAESCTGGYIAHLITRVSGASSYFMGGVTPYSNAMKQKMLNVKTTTLNTFGAVSEETVIEMVNGSLDLLETDIALAVSGIAGPGGGTSEKPVGTIWLAIGDKNNIKTVKLQLGKDRLKNIQYTSIAALNMMRKFLLNGGVNK
jgi:competence/damage-inducible protein CinA-like protein